MRLTKKEKEVAYRAIAIFNEIYLEFNDFNDEEQKNLESARLKIRKEIYGF